MARNGPDIKIVIAQPGAPRSEQVELRLAPTFHRDTGQWARVCQRVDRRLDEYHKVVFDPVSGEKLYENKERLSDHQDRGDARRFS